MSSKIYIYVCIIKLIYVCTFNYPKGRKYSDNKINIGFAEYGLYGPTKILKLIEEA